MKHRNTRGSGALVSLMRHGIRARVTSPVSCHDAPVSPMCGDAITSRVTLTPLLNAAQPQMYASSAFFRVFFKKKGTSKLEKMKDGQLLPGMDYEFV